MLQSWATSETSYLFRVALKRGRHVCCTAAQKHTIGNTSTHSWVLSSNELTQEKEIFNIYELSSHQRYFNKNLEEFQSSYANSKCDQVYIYPFICKCMKVYALYCLLKIGALSCPIKKILYLTVIYWSTDKKTNVHSLIIYLAVSTAATFYVCAQ